MKLLLALIVAALLVGQEPKPQPAQPKPAPEEAKPAEAAPPAQEAKTEEAAAAAETPAPAVEQNVTGSIDVGYRWMTDLRGSVDTYRSVVDLGEGPKLLGLDLSFEDPNHRLFDRIDVRGAGWGGDPYNTARLDARRSGSYHFTADYRNLAYFNFLPSFANPGPVSGLSLNQRSFDIHRRYYNFELDLLPGRRIVPFLGFTRDSGFGSGITDFVASSNEYPVSSALRDSMNRYRGGVRLEFNRFHITLEQGGTTFKDDQRVFTGDRNPGNRQTPIFNQTLFLANLNQQYGIRGDSIYSKVLATANPFSWLNLHGQFLFSQPKTDVSYSANGAGNFVVPGQVLFFPAFSETVTGLAKQPRTSAAAGFELRPWRRLRIVESWSTDRLHNASTAVLVETFLLGNVLSDKLIWNYNQNQVDALFDVTSRFTLRGGYRYVWGDTAVRAPSVFPSPTGQESLQLKRHVGLAGGTYRHGQRLTISADFEGAAASHSYFRTSLHDYRRGRIRARYQAIGSLGFGANFSVLSNQNPSPTIDYDFLSRENTLAVFWTPQGRLQPFNLVGEYTRSTLRSDITFLDPGTLQRERSFYWDNAHLVSAMLEAAVPGAHSPRFGIGGALFISNGSRPTRYYQPTGRVALPVHRNVHVTGEWRWYGFAERFFPIEHFRTHLFTAGLRVIR
jgi:hypothetical protein